MKNFRRFIEPVLSFAGIAWLTWFLLENSQLLSETLADAGPSLFQLSCLVLFGWVSMAAQAIILYRSQGIEMGIGESLLILASSSLLNYIPTRPGTLLRFRYMRRVHSLGYASNLGLTALRSTLMLGVSAIVAAVGLVMLLGSSELASIRAYLGGLAVVTIFAAGFILTIRQKKGDSFFAKVWNGFAGSIAAGRESPLILAGLAILVVLQLFLGALRMQIAFELSGTPVALSVLLLVAPITTVLGTLSFVTLGFREALVGSLVAATGYTFSAGVIAASAERAALVLLSVVLGTLGTLMILWRLRQRGTVAEEPGSGGG